MSQGDKLQALEYQYDNIEKDIQRQEKKAILGEKKLTLYLMGYVKVGSKLESEIVDHFHKINQSYIDLTCFKELMDNELSAIPKRIEESRGNLERVKSIENELQLKYFNLTQKKRELSQIIQEKSQVIQEKSQVNKTNQETTPMNLDETTPMNLDETTKDKSHVQEEIIQEKIIQEEIIQEEIIQEEIIQEENKKESIQIVPEEINETTQEETKESSQTTQEETTQESTKKTSKKGKGKCGTVCPKTGKPCNGKGNVNSKFKTHKNEKSCPHFNNKCSCEE